MSGAIIGGIAGLLTILIIYYLKGLRFKRLMKTVPNAEYAGLYHYATYDRYKKSMKFFDSYGLLYIVGNTLYYKANDTETPLSFDLTQITTQQEADWRRLKWFSVSTPVGEKHYFNSHKLGAFTHDSSETLRGLSAIQARTKNAA